MESSMDQPRKYVPRKREADEIARDIDRTQARIDATLEALQRKLKPSTLAKDAAKRLADSGAKTVRQLAERLVMTEQGVRARKLVADAQRTLALLPPDDIEVLKASARLAAARLMADRARRGQIVKLGAAAVGAVLAAAAIASLTDGKKKRPKPAQLTAAVRRTRRANSKASVKRGGRTPPRSRRRS